MNRILVTLDGSAVSEAILPPVRRLARRNDAEIVLLRVPNVRAGPDYDERHRNAMSDAGTYLGRVQSSLLADGFRARGINRGDAVDRMILDTARDKKVSVIAMATHGRTGLSHILLGSVAESVLRRTSLPMILLRPSGARDSDPRDERRGYRYVLVLTDGSEASLSVIPAAAAVATLMGATVRLLRVAEATSGDFTASSTGDAAEGHTGHAAAEVELRQAADRVRREKAPVEPMLRIGPVGDIISEEANRDDVDLIAMATHGCSGNYGCPYGSVSKQVLCDTDLPILIVRAKPDSDTKEVR